ncbi:hypothetical protein BN381_150125 [Candidatus Microthrix parvicella RN1]|uniref:Uncharacterized protein n=1 Tax=Candidatus Neomicrothrix parvicella RN1 TaxID=1229780 RepID=R4Z341_9ACTN|nr:hypothetical protein BN381_150125 [Candidatus Microthrix parvicella RN1]
MAGRPVTGHLTLGRELVNDAEWDVLDR